MFTSSPFQARAAGGSGAMNKSPNKRNLPLMMILSTMTLMIQIIHSQILPTSATFINPTIFFRHNVSLAFEPDPNHPGQTRFKESLPCPVIWLSKNEPLTYQNIHNSLNQQQEEPIPLGNFRAAFTDATDLVPFAKSVHPLYHVDNNEFYPMPRSFTNAKMGMRSVSFLFPPLDKMTIIMYSLYEEAKESFPNDTYIDLGTRESRVPAFYNYSFSLLLGQDDKELPSPALLDCLAYGVVPGYVWFHDDPEIIQNGGQQVDENGQVITSGVKGPAVFNHFLGYSYYFRYLVSKFRFPHFTPQSAHYYITEKIHGDAIYVMQSSLKLIQDFFYMRYSIPFSQRLLQQAKSVCTEQETNQLTPFAFIGILSAKDNFNRRQAQRNTWLRILENDLPKGYVKGVAVGGTAMKMPHPNLMLNPQDPKNLVEPERPYQIGGGGQQQGPSGQSLLVGSDPYNSHPMRIAYRFFVNRVGFVDSEQEAPDWLLRGESELWRDLVFLDIEPEYPIGNQGLAMFHWIANNTEANYIVKLDDDIYIRPVQFFQGLENQQRAGLYLGAFDYSGEVVRDPSSAHFLGDNSFVSDVFPPYARGAGVVISIDLIQKICELDRQGPGMLRRLNGGKISDVVDESTGLIKQKMSDGGYGRQIEDVSYGYYLYQLVKRGISSVTIQDLFEENFAMDAKCCTELSHPNNCWSPLKETSFLVHHMKPQQLVCMFRKDVENGMYEKHKIPPILDSNGHMTSSSSFNSHLTNQQRTMWLQNFGGEENSDSFNHYFTLGKNYTEYMNSNLCGCVNTPPAHPGQPHEGPTNVKLGDGGDGPVSKLQHRPGFEW